MENLISKWKHTVETHNRKLSQLREDSLGNSHRSHSSLANSKNIQQSQGPQISLTIKDKKRSISSSEGSSDETPPLRR